jgi:hypothetical protein
MHSNSPTFSHSAYKCETNVQNPAPRFGDNFTAQSTRSVLITRNGVTEQWTVLLVSRMSSTALPGNLAK